MIGQKPLVTDMRIHTLVLLLAAAILAGCEVTAQTPPPHKLYWENADPGNVLGYRVYCGNATGAYTQNWNIDGEQNTEIVLTTMGLADGQHFCMVTAWNFVGESDPSNEVSFYTMGGDLQQQAPAAPSNLQVM